MPFLIYKDPSGQVVKIPDDPVEVQAAQARGFVPASPEELQTAQYGGAQGVATTLGRGLAQGLTAGLSDLYLTRAGFMKQKDLEGLQSENPATDVIGQVTGALAGAALSKKIPTPAGMISRAGQGIAPTVEAAILRGVTTGGRPASTAANIIARAGGNVAAGTAEGALWGAAPAVTEAALGDPNEAGEIIASRLLQYGALGGGTSLVLSGPAAVFQALRPKNRLLNHVSRQMAKGEEGQHESLIAALDEFTTPSYREKVAKEHIIPRSGETIPGTTFWREALKDTVESADMLPDGQPVFVPGASKYVLAKRAQQALTEAGQRIGSFRQQVDDLLGPSVDITEKGLRGQIEAAMYRMEAAGRQPEADTFRAIAKNLQRMMGAEGDRTQIGLVELNNLVQAWRAGATKAHFEAIALARNFETDVVNSWRSIPLETFIQRAQAAGALRAAKPQKQLPSSTSGLAKFSDEALMPPPSPVDEFTGTFPGMAQDARPVMMDVRVLPKAIEGFVRDKEIYYHLKPIAKALTSESFVGSKQGLAEKLIKYVIQGTTWRLAFGQGLGRILGMGAATGGMQAMLAGPTAFMNPAERTILFSRMAWMRNAQDVVSASQKRMKSALSGILDKPAAAPFHVKHLGRGAGVQSAVLLLQKATGERDPQKAYEKYSRKVLDLPQDRFIDQVSTALAGSDEHFPQTSQAAATTMGHVYNAVLQALPQGHGQSKLQPMLGPQLVGDREILRFSRQLQALLDPISVFEAAKAGPVAPEQAQVLQLAYPATLKWARAQLAEMIAERKTRLSQDAVVSLSLLFGEPLETSMEPKSIALAQETFLPKQNPAKPPTPALPESGGLGNFYKTGTQSMGEVP